MPPAVHIKPSPERDGFCLYYGDLSPVWFAHEHHALGHARDLYPESEIILFEGEGIIKRRYPPSVSR